MSLILPILITSLIGICTIILTLYEIIKVKTNTLPRLLQTILSLNIIWYTGILIQFLTTRKVLQEVFFLEVILSTCIFICRLYFLYSFYRLTETILNQHFLRTINKPFRITSIVLTAIYTLAWAEVLINNSKSITNTFMIYTDIIVFGLVLGGCVFLIQKAKQYKNDQDKSIIRLLGIVFFIPMTLAVLKWMLSNTSIMSDSVTERISIHLFITLFNLSALLWVIVSRKKIRNIESVESGFNSDSFRKKYNISKRELEIIKQVSEGKTNQEIADILFISIETVKDHNSNIYLKTGVKNRTQLAKLYIDSIRS